MSFQKFLKRTIGVAWVTLLLVGCGAPADTPVSEAPTATAVPPTATPTQTPIPSNTPVPTNSPLATTTIDLESKVGTDIFSALPEGDVEQGKLLAIRWTCMTCHVANHAGPDFGSEYGETAIFERAKLRIADPNYSGSATTPEEFIIESILLPADYLAPGEWDDEHEHGPMKENYGELLTVHDLASLMAYLKTFE